MVRLIPIVLLLAFAGLLPAQGLIDELFADRIADDWQREFRLWVEDECEQERFPETWFSDAEGEPVRHRILGVEDGKLVAAPLAPTARKGRDGNPVMEQGNRVFFDWEDWQPRYMLSTYGLANRDDRTLVAFAVWLYHSDSPLPANRVLTALHDRNEELRDRIEAYVRDKEDIAEGEKLIVAEVWDDEFKRLRRVLMTEDKAKEHEKAAEMKAAAELERLVREYKKPEERTLTLSQLAIQLERWRTRFARTRFADKRAKVVDALRKSIRRDIEAVEVFFEVADKEPEVKKRAEEYDKALKLDPRSLHVLARAAKAWMDYADPEVKGRKFICTQEHGARRAGELYQRWLEIEPENVKAMLNRAVCHHVIGNRTEATALYRKVTELDTDDDATTAAKRYKDLD